MIDLTKIIGQREGYRLEAKSAKGGFPATLWETYSAFANGDGGVILLGVEEDHAHKMYMRDGLADVGKMEETFWKQVDNRQKVNRNIVTNSMVYPAKLEDKDILVIEVPRAERTIRPVFTGMDPFEGTYRRNGDGDHHCTREEVGALMRDASTSPLDAVPIQSMGIDVFCQESINAYRQVFKQSNPNHLWNRLEDEIFLRRLKAIAMADDGKYHPTEAGLLMFGWEYEITNRFPQYFLDYQEDRVLTGVTRWKDRITSSSGDWSGNLFDFAFKVLSKLQADFKMPFVLRRNNRMDDTPLHKVLREAVTNCLVHADYDGRQGVVIIKNKDGFVFANPGRLRISVEEATSGCVSDPRNATLLKMFSFIRFGERAGSGLNGILYVWNRVYHTDATIREKEGGVDRTILTLSHNGNKQDVDAMIQLYDDADELTIGYDDTQDVTQDDTQGVNVTQDVTQGDTQSVNVTQDDTQETANAISLELDAWIVEQMSTNPKVTAEELASLAKVAPITIKRHISKIPNVRYVGSGYSGHWEVKIQ